MNKEEFLSELKNHLNKMDVAEKNRFLTYYDEMISDYVENGLSEEDAINKIGSPIRVAKELMENYESINLNIPSTGYKIWNIILLILGFPLWGSLLLAGVMLVLSFYIVIWCLPLVTAASSVGFLASSIIGIIGTPFVLVHSAPMGIVQLGLAVAAIGISFLSGLATIYLSKRFILVTKDLNVKMVSFFQKVVKK